MKLIGGVLGDLLLIAVLFVMFAIIIGFSGYLDSVINWIVSMFMVRSEVNP